MSRPPKPFEVLKNEKKSHRTKAEMKKRQQGEASLSTGTALQERPEVRSNPIAHREFQRLNALLRKIEKNDAIYEVIINRYCLMHAECFDLEVKREKIYESATLLENALEEMRQKPDVSFNDLKSAIRGIADIYATMIECDRQVQAKRKMLLDIEKENVMTIAAALRSIPKKAEKEGNPLLKALSDE
ncbi:MAG: hypothetical protein N2376_01490 [Clostridia bacterium]|nr:hypothetical protein [Clostridia bacterium]